MALCFEGGFRQKIKFSVPTQRFGHSFYKFIQNEEKIWHTQFQKMKKRCLQILMFLLFLANLTTIKNLIWCNINFSDQ